MAADELKTGILECVKKLVEHSAHPEWYREPVIGYADTEDPLYDQLDEIIGNPQFKPEDMLTGARSVVVVFIPNSEVVFEDMKNSVLTSSVYSESYMLTNSILDEVSEQIIRLLEEKGYHGVSDPPTENFDHVTKIGKWSHKSNAVIAGIGTIGLNHLLITEKGCLGRLTSVVTDAPFSASPKPDHPYCLYYLKGRCRACIRNCPSGALCSDGRIDKRRCDSYLEGKNCSDMQQGCPKCQTVPCALRGF